MYGNNRKAGPAPHPKQRPNKGTGHYWPHYYPCWYDYDTDYDWNDYDWNDYDDWYDWVWTSAYEKGIGEGRKQGFAHAMNLSSEGSPKPVAPTPAPMPEANTMPSTGNVYPHTGNVYPHTTGLGI